MRAHWKLPTTAERRRKREMAPEATTHVAKTLWPLVMGRLLRRRDRPLVLASSPRPRAGRAGLKMRSLSRVLCPRAAGGCRACALTQRSCWRRQNDVRAGLSPVPWMSRQIQIRVYEPASTELVSTSRLPAACRCGQPGGRKRQRRFLDSSRKHSPPANATSPSPTPRTTNPAPSASTRTGSGSRAAHREPGHRPRPAALHHQHRHPDLRNTFRTRVWQPAVTASGVDFAVRMHDLRHAHASWLLAEGSDLAASWNAWDTHRSKPPGNPARASLRARAVTRSVRRRWRSGQRRDRPGFAASPGQRERDADASSADRE